MESFPEQLKAAVAEAVKEATQRIGQEAENKEALLVKEFEGEKNVLSARIESLETTIKEQTQQIAKLSQALDKAYHQVQDIAVKAVEGSSSAKSLVGLEQFLAEQQKKVSKEQ